MRARRVFTFILFCVALSVPRVGAQVLSLQFGDATPGFEAAVGDTIEVEVRTDLQGFSAAGVALYLSIPDGPFEVVGAPGADRGSQPFRAGPFFGEAVELANSLVPQDLIPDSNRGRLLLHFAAVHGPGFQRSKAGSGVVARFWLVCREPIRKAVISLHSDAIHESLLVSPDGRSERHFYLGGSLELTVGLSAAAKSVHPRSWGSLKLLRTPAVVAR